MRFVKFIRKNFFFFPAGYALAFKRLEMFEFMKSGAMLWCGHDIYLFHL